MCTQMLRKSTEIVKNLPELHRLELDVVTDYEFEIEFKYMKNLSTLTMHTYSYDGFYFRKRTFKHLPLTQIKFLEIDRIFKIDNDTFSNLTDIQTLLI